VTPIPVACFGAKLFRLRKADGTTHLVASTLEGFSCDCADDNPADDCDHVKAMVAVGLFERKGGAR
jgi:hypothetical protein